MMKKLIFTIFTLLIAIMPAVAENWRTGVTFGYLHNELSYDRMYMVDWHCKGEKGITAGMMGQYDFNDWLSVRTDVNWTEKNYRLYRTGEMEGSNYRTTNGYLQIPVMASMSFGGNRLRGFMNLGLYAGWHLTSHRKGTMTSIHNQIQGLDNYVYDIDEDCFNRNRDRRFEWGIAGGAGIDWRFKPNWGAQLEGRCYYSLLSTEKSKGEAMTPRYNTTLGLQAAIYYCF